MRHHALHLQPCLQRAKVFVVRNFSQVKLFSGQGYAEQRVSYVSLDARVARLGVYVSPQLGLFSAALTLCHEAHVTQSQQHGRHGLTRQLHLCRTLPDKRMTHAQSHTTGLPSHTVLAPAHFTSCHQP